ncbi:hypothetical protein J4446_03135 [Candidatus Woesearchaeota archaeon]|nr:hypothetical protein [Candidatus Woesearchaeota archaeon]
MMNDLVRNIVLPFTVIYNLSNFIPAFSQERKVEVGNVPHVENNLEKSLFFGWNKPEQESENPNEIKYKDIGKKIEILTGMDLSIEEYIEEGDLKFYRNYKKDEKEKAPDNRRKEKLKSNLEILEERLLEKEGIDSLVTDYDKVRLAVEKHKLLLSINRGADGRYLLYDKNGNVRTDSTGKKAIPKYNPNKEYTFLYVELPTIDNPTPDSYKMVHVFCLETNEFVATVEKWEYLKDPSKLDGKVHLIDNRFPEKRAEEFLGYVSKKYTNQN